MNLAQARQQFPHLNDYSDEELLGIVAQSNNIAPDSPTYRQLESQLLSHYDRSWGDVAADTFRGVAGGLAGIGEMAGTIGGALLPGVSAYDNAVTNTFGQWRERIAESNSPGMRAMQEESRRRAAIAEQQAQGEGFLSEIGASAGAQAGSYWDMPATAFQDFVTNAPQLLVGGVAARGVQLGARGLGLGAGASARAGVAGGVGTSSAMQGADVGNETYERAIAAGATPEQATELANQAAVRAGAASVGLSLLPGGTAIERSLVRGAGPGRLGLGLVGRGFGEAVTEGLEEGYGRYAGNEAVQVVDPNVRLSEGVGSAAVQGAAVGGPLGAVMRPRTATGEIDLTGAPQPDIRTERAGNVEVTWDNNPPPREEPVNYDRPTWQRRGLTSDEVMTPVQQGPALLPNQPGIYVDPTGQAQVGGMPSEQDMAMRRYAPQPADPAPAPQAPQLPYNPTMFVDPTGTAQNFTPTEEDVLQRRYAPQPADPAPAEQPVEQPADIRTQLQTAAAEVRPTYLKKDGTLTKSAEAAFAKILNAKDPATAIRDAHQDGGGPRDEVLDTLHRLLTGQTVFDYRAGGQVNSAGFVSEPTEQLQAQADAVREGRKQAMVVGTDEVNRVDLAGVPQAVITDPANGEQAVIASADPQIVAQTQARANEVGMRQALGEAQGVANPTLTSNPTQDSMTVQQVDNETGQVIGEEVITEQDIPNVREIPGTTARVVPNEQVIGDRVAAADAPLEAQPAEPAPAPQPAPTRPQRQRPPRFGRAASEDLIQIVENDNDPDPARYNEALYELYKRSATDSDEGVAGTYLAANPPTRSEQQWLAERFAPEKVELERKAAEREAKEGQRRGRQFGASFRARSEVPQQTLPAREIQSIIDSIKRTSPAAAGVELMDSPADVGLDVPDGFIAEGVTLPDGRIVLFPGALATRQDVERVVFHELFHRGLRASMEPAQYARTMANIAARDPRVFQYANQWKASTIGQQTRDAMADGRPLTGDRLASYEATAVDEALARVAEELMADRLPGSRRGVVRNLAAWVANVADTLGLKNLAQWLRRQTYNEQEQFVIDTLARAGDPVNPPPPRGGERFRGRNGPAQPLAQANRAAQADIRKRSLSENLLNVLSVRQIDEQFGKYLPAFRDWSQAIFERASKASRIAGKADRVALQWERRVKDKAQREALADILLRASVGELSLDNTSSEYLASLDANQRKEHAALRAKLASLPPEVRQIRTEVRQILEEQWRYTRQSLENFIEHTISDPELRAQRIKDLRTEFGKRRGDYFPLSRFGDTVVVARGAASDGRDTIQFFEREADAVKEVQRLRQAGVKQVNITRRTDTNTRERASTAFMNDLHRSIDQAEMSPEAKEALHESLQQLFLKSLPEVSGAKHMIRRENIEGWSTDALRAFADSVTRGARYASHLEFAPTVQAALESAATQSRSSDKRQAAVVIGEKEGSAPAVRVVPMGTQRLNAFNELAADGYTVRFFNTIPESARESLAAALPGATDAQLDNYLDQIGKVVGRTETGVEDLRNAKTLYNFMVSRQRHELQPETLLSKAVDVGGQVGYTWFLGFTPAFWLMNILQNPMVGIPHLGAKYGVGRSSAEWGKAMTWFTQVRMGKLMADHKTPFSIEWLSKAVADQNIKGISQAELKMLQRLEDRQVLDFTQSMDLARIGENSSNKWTKAMRLAAAGAHHTEVFNRVSFALAAYRLALKSNPDITHEQAVQMAENDVAAAHFDYSGTNKPELMQGKARLIFMFQQYRQHMLYWWAKQVKDALGKDANREDRIRAGKGMLLMATTQGLFAGALGLPFMGAVHLAANLIGAAFGDDDEPFEFEHWMTDAAKAHFGEEGGTLFSKGVFAALGMNISQRIGQADLLPFANMGSARFERNRDDQARAYLFDLLGPMGSIALGIARSMDDFERGDVLAGIADASPKASGDIARALQMNNEGIKNSRGQVLATQEAFDGWDVAMQAAGVTPLEAAKIRDRRGKLLEVENHYVERGRNLRAAFVEAWSRNDQEGMAEALTDIHKFNRNLVKKYGNAPDLVNSFGITKQKLESAARDHKQRALFRALTGGSAETKRQAMLALQMSGMLAQPQPSADPAWDAGWN